MAIISNELYGPVILLVIFLMTNINYGQHITEGSYHVLRDCAIIGKPIFEVVVHSEIECVVFCQGTQHCTATETQKYGQKEMCKLFDNSSTISKQLFMGAYHTVTVKGKSISNYLILVTGCIVFTGFIKKL